MKYKVAIRNNIIGETRIRDMGDTPWEEGSLWWWTEGNFGCDCNREKEWHRAAHESFPENTSCGDTRFSVPYAELEDGTIIRIDKDKRGY